MDDTESLQLFTKKVFGRRGVPHDDQEQYQQLAQSAIQYTRDLPLALCVLGPFFCGRDILTEWEDVLVMLKRESKNGIFEIIKISYHDLNNSQKIIFLDIACFFNMWGKDEIIQILESRGLPVTSVVHMLWEKSLLAEIEIGNTTYIEMHDLVQDMGRHIVIEDSPVYIQRRNR